MHKALAALVLLSTLGAACSGGGGADTDALKTNAQTVVTDIFAGRYAAVRAEFDDTVLAGLSVQRLAGARASFEARFGSFERMGDPAVVHKGDLTVINVPLHMSRGDAQARITFDGEQKIAGLYLLRPGVPVG